MQFSGTREELRQSLAAHLEQHRASCRARLFSDLVAYPACVVLLMTLVASFAYPWLVLVDAALMWAIWKSLIRDGLRSGPLDAQKLACLQSCLELDSGELDDSGRWSVRLDSGDGFPLTPPENRPGSYPFQHLWGELSAPLLGGGKLQVELERIGQVSFLRTGQGWVVNGFGSDALRVRCDGEVQSFQPISRVLGPGELVVRLLSGLLVFRWDFRPALRFQPSELAFHLAVSLPGSNLPAPFRLPRNPWVKVLVLGPMLGIPVVLLLTGRLQFLWNPRIKALVPATPLPVKQDLVPYGFRVHSGLLQVENLRENHAGQWAADVEGGSLIIDGFSTQNVHYFEKTIERHWTGGKDYQTVEVDGHPGRRSADTLWLRTPAQCLKVYYFHRDARRQREFFDRLRVASEFRPGDPNFQIQWPLP
ncbi:MAG: hypothetical protein J0I12_06820 [Candidatus Eremiobacteraeota bacterium]|nr:hypothetical protein [Candidatus Eremiobacteraeota bacterium]